MRFASCLSVPLWSYVSLTAFPPRHNTPRASPTFAQYSTRRNGVSADGVHAFTLALVGEPGLLLLFALAVAAAASAVDEVGEGSEREEEDALRE